MRVTATDDCPFHPRPSLCGAHWALPRLVGEVAYAASARVGLIRHSSWHRLRQRPRPRRRL
ncbi:hypothetical protein [Embleya scabrispora]|uniref:hypothetical protein n=1 Tax=Embleya scabrispora TaxID=159449 RepID=UPI001FE1BD0C|nr:hypothetical protein [Embleya scabrispora]